MKKHNPKFCGLCRQDRVADYQGKVEAMVSAEKQDLKEWLHHLVGHNIDDLEGKDLERVGYNKAKLEVHSKIDSL